jgi:hypothetical protein
MRAYEKLTPRGKLRRARSVARAALDSFGFTDADLRLIVDAGNVLYRVKAVDPAPVKSGLYLENCYLLRLHWPGYQNDGAVDSELKWLHALSSAGLPVPQPVATTKGELSARVSVPGVPEARRCSLLRWVKGRMASKRVHPWHMKAIGRLMARLHNHASSWRPPSGFVRRHYDRNGLWETTLAPVTPRKRCGRGYPGDISGFSAKLPCEWSESWRTGVRDRMSTA